MDWDALLLLLAGLFMLYTSSRLTYQTESIKYLCYTLGAVFYILGQGGQVLEAVLMANEITIDSTIFVEINHVTAVSFVLCGLAVFIRESKPVFAQFPLIYAAVPLLLILSYWIVKDSFAIKNWLMSIYQAGALLVATMMYGAHTYRNPELQFVKFMLGATGLFTLTYILYWFVPVIQDDYNWIWQVSMGISLLIAGIACLVKLKEQQ